MASSFEKKFLFIDLFVIIKANMLDSNTDERRQDLHQTSTGVGHQYRPGYYFPSSNFKVKFDQNRC